MLGFVDLSWAYAGFCWVVFGLSWDYVASLGLLRAYVHFILGLCWTILGLCWVLLGQMPLPVTQLFANLVLAGVLVVLLVVLVSVLVVLEVVVLLRLLMFLVLFFAVRLAIC